MRRLSVDTLISLVGVLVACLVGLLPIGVAYDLSRRGEVAPKALRASTFSSVDPLSDLRQAKDKIVIQVKSDGKELANLRVVQTSVQNTGKAPILPDDTFEPLAISTKAPWRIVTVVPLESDGRESIRMSWTRKSDVQFVGARTLLNPGDAVSATVYLTMAERENVNPTIGEPPIFWTARIANLKAIENKPLVKLDEFFRAFGPVSVLIFGWGVPFIVITFAALVVLYLMLFGALGWLETLDFRAGLLWLGAMMLSLCGAEAATTYVFGPTPLRLTSVNHALNAPFILTNVVALSVLLWRRRRRLARASALATPRP